MEQIEEEVFQPLAKQLGFKSLTFNKVCSLLPFYPTQSELESYGSVYFDVLSQAGKPLHPNVIVLQTFRLLGWFELAKWFQIMALEVGPNQMKEKQVRGWENEGYSLISPQGRFQDYYKLLAILDYNHSLIQKDPFLLTFYLEDFLRPIFLSDRERRSLYQMVKQCLANDGEFHLQIEEKDLLYKILKLTNYFGTDRLLNKFLQKFNLEKYKKLDDSQIKRKIICFFIENGWFKNEGTIVSYYLMNNFQITPQDIQICVLFTDHVTRLFFYSLFHLTFKSFLTLKEKDDCQDVFDQIQVELIDETVSVLKKSNIHLLALSYPIILRLLPPSLREKFFTLVY